MNKDEWIGAVISNISDQTKREQVKRELEVMIHDLSFASSEERVLNKLGNPEIYYQKHYIQKDESKFYRIIFLLGIVLIVGGASFLYLVISNAALFDHGVRTAFGASTSPIYFGGMVIGIGIVMMLGSIGYLRMRKP